MASNIAAVVSAVATAVAAGSVAVAVSAATKASPKDFVETVAPLADKIGSNVAKNAGTAVAQGLGVIAAAMIISTLITTRGLKK